jgi:mRNA-degrading endonuclease RelE of RelBE toxin-antitoxin system
MLSPMLQTMAEYQVLLSLKAQSYYKRVDADTVQSLQDCFVALEQKPTDWQHPHIKRLRGRLSGLWRYRAGGTCVSFIALTRMPVWLMWWTLGPAEISTNQVTPSLLIEEPGTSNHEPRTIIEARRHTRIMDHGVGIRLSRMKAVLCARF